MYWHNHDEDDLDNHHPTCKGPCGQLADECMCSWPKEYWYVESPKGFPVDSAPVED